MFPNRPWSGNAFATATIFRGCSLHSSLWLTDRSVIPRLSLVLSGRRRLFLRSPGRSVDGRDLDWLNVRRLPTKVPMSGRRACSIRSSRTARVWLRPLWFSLRTWASNVQTVNFPRNTSSFVVTPVRRRRVLHRRVICEWTSWGVYLHWTWLASRKRRGCMVEAFNSRKTGSLRSGRN